MGSASSKAARKLGTEVSATTKTSIQNSSSIPQKHAKAAKETASRFVKDQSILDDARDPQLLRNLDALGPVQAKDVRIPTSTSGTMLHVMQARSQTEPTEETPLAVQRLSASEILRLLTEYQARPSSQALDQLAVEYDVDRELLGKVVRYVHAPEEQPTP
ncbi:hypothetical protein MNAN1_003461 [Malassezia nana]|uniref:Uncharacterized protein n=1 Tax=Malassezia nana TaxID=180528 RepID=A0AAF0J8V4_9BASI|nr:hypothetical protein MNAN1_003461 [Malassezia nana]